MGVLRTKQLYISSFLPICILNLIVRDLPEHRVAVFLNQLRPSAVSTPSHTISATQQNNEEEGDKVSSMSSYIHIHGLKHFQLTYICVFDTIPVLVSGEWYIVHGFTIACMTLVCVCLLRKSIECMWIHLFLFQELVVVFKNLVILYSVLCYTCYFM